MTNTKSATIECARAVVKQLHERNRSTWDELDRETVHAINALVSYAEWLRAQQALERMAENARELGLDYEPPQRKPLTDEEIEFIYADTGYNDIQMFARAIEAAHGIKGNT